jgi:hypothetical protein
MKKVKQTIKKTGKVIKYTTFLGIAFIGAIIATIAIITGCKSKCNDLKI